MVFYTINLGDNADAFVNIAVLHEILVVLSGVGYVEIKAFCSIPLGEHAVQREGDLRVDIRPERVIGPVGEYLG